MVLAPKNSSIFEKDLMALMPKYSSIFEKSQIRGLDGFWACLKDERR